MAQRRTNLRPVAVMVALVVVVVLLIGLATAGLAATAGNTGAPPTGLFNWLLAGQEATPLPAVAQPCMAELMRADEGPRAAVLVPGSASPNCGS